MTTAAPAGTGRLPPGRLDPQTYLRERYQGAGARSARVSAYYVIKPLLPRPIQLALRRLYARRQAQVEFPAWPIEPLLVEHLHEQLRARLRLTNDARVPLVSFWPEGRRFAAILTHDVEGAAGVENISRVLEVERRHGMVSSWNFVADWYPIPGGTFEAVRNAGCEVGLHGIKHDGKLFTNRATFAANLPLIHRALRDWDAVGFRSPATHRNAEWMHELGCLYDSSFPDTDPFEPQAGGCCSILPYMLGDLVELPITLVQDHTLWEILRDDSIELWTRKTDWIVRQHGLVNIILHPDYVLDAQRLATYDRFLGFLRERLDREAGWHALPREVAAWWKTREALSVETEADGTRVVGPGANANGAAVAWAREVDGEILIDCD